MGIKVSPCSDLYRHWRSTMGRGRIKAEPGDPSNSIAARIRAAMTACGMKSVAELGRRIGLPRQTVHRWINGDTKNMTHENLYKVADALQVRARWLGAAPPPPPPPPPPRGGALPALTGRPGFSDGGRWCVARPPRTL